MKNFALKRRRELKTANLPLRAPAAHINRIYNKIPLSSIMAMVK